MAELFVNIYFRHNDQAVHSKLFELFEMHSDDDGTAAGFVDLAMEINPERGEALAKGLLSETADRLPDFEEVEDLSGFCCAGITCGRSGDSFAKKCVRFLAELTPGVQAQAWGTGDDDPWEFWLKDVDGHVVRHDSEPYRGCDTYVKSTIYRWWHEGMPEDIQEGLLNDDEDDYVDEDDESEAVTEEEYQAWVANQSGGSNLEDDVEEFAMEEMVSDLTGALGDLFGGLFGGGSRNSKSPSLQAFDAETIDETLIRSVLDDLQACTTAYDVDGYLKHFSKSLKGKMVTIESGQEVSMPINFGLYRMSLKLMLKEEAQYEGYQELLDVSIDNNVAIAKTKSTAKFIDPTTNQLSEMSTNDVYTFEIIDDKIQITVVDSKADSI